jgi:hypothetical protein
MEEAPQNVTESSHSANANGMNECDYKSTIFLMASLPYKVLMQLHIAMYLDTQT